LYNLRIKDCQFDEDSGILSLTGKSGTRTNRVFYSVPDLRQQLNNHPARDDPNARLFHFGFHDSTKFNLNTVYHRVRSLGLKVLKKPIHPHMFRHTHATENTRLYNDRENMMLFGWNSPSMIKVYSHLTMKDVDEKVLVLHGRKRKEEVLRPIVSVQRCSSCQAENAPIAVYCHKCGQILASVTDEKIKEQMQKQAERVKEFEILAAKQAEDMQLLKAQIEEMDHKVTNAIVIASTEGEVFSGMLEKGYDQYLKEHPAMRRFFELDPKRAEDISHWITFEQTFMEEAKKNPKLSHKKLYKLVQKTMVERGKAKEDLSKTVA
jgi:ribosomal protein L40E